MNVFELDARINLKIDEYMRNLNTAQSSTESVASKIGRGFSNIAKAVGTGVGVAAGAVSLLVKQSVDGYAELEQLVGGVETLFGDSAQQVLDDASQAFKTAGLSMNDYMETSIQSAAALINSLGGDQAEAAKLMNTSIVDMSDNVNKMGTSMEAVQNAYRGFSRGNFTMLDNLALGFSGTKEGMQELIDKANEINKTHGIMSDYAIDSYSDIVQAIHVVQEEMGIAGTTAYEASTTIQGSAASMRSAWENLITGLGDKDADLSALIENVVSSAETTVTNLIPVIETALGGIGTLVEGLAPIIAEKLPDLITSVLPSLLTATVSLINGLLAALPSLISLITQEAPSIITSIVNALVANLPAIIKAGTEMVVSLVDGLVDAIPTLIPAAIDMVFAIVDGIIDNLPAILDAALELVIALAEGILQAIPDLIDRLPELIDSIVTFVLESIPTIIDAGIQLLTALVTALPTIIEKIVEVLPQIIDGIITALLANLPLIIEAGISLITALIEDLPTIITTIVKAIPDIIFSIVDAVIAHVPDIINAGVDLLMSLVENLPDIIAGIVGAIGQVLEAVLSAISDYFFRFATSGADLVKKIAEGIDTVKQWFTTRWQKFISDAKQKFTDLVDGAKSWGRDMIQNFVNGITEKFRALKQKVIDVANSVKNMLGFSVPKEGPLHDADTYMPDFMQLLARGIEQRKGIVLNAANELASGIEDTMLPSVDMGSGLTDETVSTTSASNVWNVTINVPESIASDRDRVRYMAQQLYDEMMRENAYAV